MRLDKRIRSHFLAACVALLPVFCGGQTLSPYSAFQSMSLSDLQTAEVKLTYFGVQNSVVASVGLATGTFDPTLFTPFRRSGIDYSNEDFAAFKTGTVSNTDIQSIINNVGSLSNVTAGGVAADPFVSFALGNTAGGTKVFEAVLNSTDAAALFTKLRASLLLNKSALLAVSTMACPLGLIDPATPTDVTSSFTITYSGFRLNRTTGHFVGTAKLLNKTASSITGPISLVLQLNGNASLASPSGATCGTSPVGLYYMDVSSGNLAGSASLNVSLDILNQSNDPIVPNVAKILAGAGTR